MFGNASHANGQISYHAYGRIESQVRANSRVEVVRKRQSLFTEFANWHTICNAEGRADCSQGRGRATNIIFILVY